ncbi:MAG: EAL domain-containing protein [Burkholderiaceae bacterium]
MTRQRASTDRLLERQIAAATDEDGRVDLGALAARVRDSYADFERDRRRSDHANRLMGDELQEANLRLESLIGQLRQNNGWLQLALDNMSQGLCLLDHAGAVVLCNERFSGLFGLPGPETLRGQLLETAIVSRSALRNMTNKSVKAAHAYLELIHGKTGATAQLELPDERMLRVAFEPTGDGGSVQTVEDVTERHEAEQTIAHLASHDVLTNLPNRRLLGQRLAAAVARAAEHGQVSAILCLDLDRFKAVNDTLGHGAGDRLLQAVADRLRGCVKTQDTVARLGGDEFAIVVERPQGSGEVETLAQHIVDVVSQPYLIDGLEALVGVSIGIASAPRDATDADQLVKCADMAMYRAKQRGRGCYEVFTPDMDVVALERRRLEMDLRQAIAEHQFRLDYQPVFDIDSKQICAAEALLRWDSPTRGVVAPDAFIPLSEELGLIVPIGEWVLREACRAAASWPREIRVAVNVSARQFVDGKLVETVEAALADFGLDPARLELELTETVLMAPDGSPLETLHRLRALGVAIVMDDFGTGYSSLAYLRSFPFDKIKIDRSFIEGLGSRADATAVVRAVTTLCDNLGVVSTAEGVETAEQLAMLDGERCDQAQGFHLGRPASEETLVELLNAETRAQDAGPTAGPALARRVATTHS